MCLAYVNQGSNGGTIHASGVSASLQGLLLLLTDSWFVLYEYSPIGAGRILAGGEYDRGTAPAFGTQKVKIG